MPWTPPPRAPWVDKLAVTGRALGDDGRSIVSLDAADLLAAAEATTGLTDWGDDWFRAPLDVLTESLESEARLHLAGRLRARTELQRTLQGRLQLVDLCSLLLRDDAARAAVSQQLVLHANEFVAEATGHLTQSQQWQQHWQGQVEQPGPAVMLQQLSAALQHVQQLAVRC